ncbi:winged helix-turn-helix transcriptional regulator [Methanosphaerula palustris]|uniref:Transcriptional regulator, HxlR family n=1 Tax=Methanosphaerula palustris (strain ATCC BAA-1556 / DSM 19958 / E1-9c) TaxID=521011 RepID=B8GHJ2_METPE|nr:helix-turn-helix domain-containing protein [Methanosphaerula palustris]ACL16597.1 transcriptional regulator, HxlR family [Methanosphaerula palustris E1-9c]
MTKNKDFWRWIEAALNVIGGKWKLLIVIALKDGTQRYNEISRKLPAISERMLVKQLREMEHDGIITRTVYAVVPAKVEYSLTQSGEKLIPVLKILGIWSVIYLGSNTVCEGLSEPVEVDPIKLSQLLEDLDGILQDADNKIKRQSNDN